MLVVILLHHDLRKKSLLVNILGSHGKVLGLIGWETDSLKLL